MRTSTFCLTALCLLGTSLSSQNIVKNGDFENGTTSWNVSGGGQLAGVTSFNVSGLGNSNAYAVRADKNGPHVLSQSVNFINGVTYEITMDLTQTSTFGNNQGVAFEVYISGKKVADWTKGSGAIAAQTTDRERLCARVLVNWLTSSSAPFDVHFIRPLYGANQRTPQGMVDNIDVRIATDPSVCPRGERKLGGTLLLEMVGTANAKVALFIAPTNMTPVSLPGFPIGKWELKGGIPVLFGSLDSNGLLKQSFPIPGNTALDGAFVWWQGVAAIPTLSLGPAHKWGIYK